jgi:hypothetical protein
MNFQVMFNPELSDIITDLLKTDAPINQDGLAIPWYSFLKLNKRYRPLIKLSRKRSYKAFAKSFEKLKDPGILQDDFIIHGIRKLLVPDFQLERLLTFIRRYYCEHPEKINESVMTLLVSLAIYCFYTEYVFAVDDNEQPKVKSLAGEISASTDPGKLKAQIVLYASYQPLTTLDNVGDLQKQFAEDKELSDLIRIQVTEPAEELRLKDTIKPLTDITDKMSVKVREQYEEFPYPRWRTVASNYEVGIDFMIPVRNVLIAGCGTGREALTFALAMPDARARRRKYRILSW